MASSSHHPQHHYHYAFDAVPLLDGCISTLQVTIDQDLRGAHAALYDMKEALVTTERLLHRYLLDVLHMEQRELHQRQTASAGMGVVFEVDPSLSEGGGPADVPTNAATSSSCIQETVAGLQRVLEEKRRQQELQQRRNHFWNNPQEATTHLHARHPYYTARSATDTLLFRLIVALQLCLVRIDDAHLVLTGRRINKSSIRSSDDEDSVCEERQGFDEQQRKWLWRGATVGLLGVAGTAIWVVSRDQTGEKGSSRISSIVERLPRDQDSCIRTLAKAASAGLAGKWAHSKLKVIWMTDKITRTTHEINDWIQQWQMVQMTRTPSSGDTLDDRINENPHEEVSREEDNQHHSPELMDDRSRRLIEYAMAHSPKSPYLCQTQGEVRFLMLKRFMDVYYASVGTAIDTASNPTSTWQVPFLAGAAASFYSITGTGASQKASHAVNTASRDLIQHAWGMVSLPAIKTLMLQASRLLKGASVADRIEICGVPCFALSRAPAPELAAALKRQNSQQRRRSQTALLSRMSTITESEEHSNEDEDMHVFRLPVPKHFAGSCGRYRQRDVIFHLTGGGFFAHTIASDLPYLLDWSASTGAVVICPEYALLPEHTFPVALDQISDVYSALVNGDTVLDLGFEVNRIVVTGESTGGNLAAALCVKHGMNQLEMEQLLNESLESESDAAEVMSTDTVGEDPTRLPDALMLSCAALNLSLELTHSRVIGTQDPVLPSGLISAISDAYLPPGCGSKQDPLASPFFAPDPVLKLFPPTLLFAGSNDPLLDDSVAFNERLRCLGVHSELRAAHNMPHAYWGLGTAGFPEAQQVQQECQEWLARQFR